MDFSFVANMPVFLIFIVVVMHKPFWVKVSLVSLIFVSASSFVLFEISVHHTR